MIKKFITFLFVAASLTFAQLAPTFHWDGTDTEGKVDTGSDGEGAGYWYTYDDTAKPNNGDSQISFPADVVENEYGNFFGPLCEAYGGIKGHAELGSAYDYPFVGLGFNLVSELQEGGDISAWGGICLTYSSTAAFAIELGAENEATVTEYNNYKAAVSKSATTTSMDFPWAKFKQETGWGVTVPQATILQAVSAIKLKFASASGDFFIQEIGSVGQCGSVAPITPAIENKIITNSSLRIIDEQIITDADVGVYNLDGTLISKSKDISGLNQGVYIVKAGSEQKIIKK